jgi:hypothetical protein
VRAEFNQTKGNIAMKKLAFAAVAAIVATVSLSSVAEAHRHHFDDWGRHHDHWGHRHDFDVVVFRRPDCSTTKIIKQTDFGTKVVVVKRCD